MTDSTHWVSMMMMIMVSTVCSVAVLRWGGGTVLVMRAGIRGRMLWSATTTIRVAILSSPMIPAASRRLVPLLITISARVWSIVSCTMTGAAITRWLWVVVCRPSTVLSTRRPVTTTLMLWGGGAVLIVTWLLWVAVTVALVSSVAIHFMSVTWWYIIYISIVITGYTTSMTFTACRQRPFQSVSWWLWIMVLATTTNIWM